MYLASLSEDEHADSQSGFERKWIVDCFAAFAVWRMTDILGTETGMSLAGLGPTGQSRGFLKMSDKYFFHLLRIGFFLCFIFRWRNGVI